MPDDLTVAPLWFSGERQGAQTQAVHPGKGTVSLAVTLLWEEADRKG